MGLMDEICGFEPVRFPLVSEDGRMTGEVRVTPCGFYRAYIKTPVREQNKLFRAKYGRNNHRARKWIAEEIKRYDDFKARRGEFVND